MTILHRRTILSGAAAAAAGALPGAGMARAQARHRLSVTSYAGIWEKAVRDIFVAEFRSRTGMDADVLIGGPPQWMSQIEANKVAPPIHVLVNTIDLALIAGRTGLVEKLDPAKVPSIADVPQRFVDLVDGWGVCFDYGSAGLAYHRGRVRNPPKSFVEFVERAEKGEFKVSLPGIAYAPTPQILIWSLADVFGGSVDNVDPGFAAIRRMRRNTIFYNGATDFLNHLESGEADIGIYFDGRTWAHYSSGASWIGYINPSEGGVMNPVVAQKVVNSPEAAWTYIDVMLSPGPQLKFAEALQYGVTNSRVQYPPQLAERITPWEQTRFPPFEALGRKIPEWVDRWNREIRS